MHSYTHILFCADLSEHSIISAHRAIELAKKFSAKLTMIHVVESLPAYASGYLGVADVERELLETAKKEMKKIATTLNIPSENQILVIGNPAMEIFSKAESLGVDLIVVGSHEKHGLDRLLGSNAGGILHKAHCDVLTVKIQAE
jgi:universal stress protein A